MPPAVRFDESTVQTLIYDHASLFLVRCPRCQECATVAGERSRPARLTCASCGLSKTSNSSPAGRSEPFDPWFGLPLWLQAPCRGHVLWAWNRPHLEFLRQYVTASLREREPNVNGSFVSRLPRWLKAAGNREEILRCIDTLSGQA